MLVDNAKMQAGIAGVLVDDLADIDPIPQEMEQCAAAERLTAERLAFGCSPRLGMDALGLQLDDQLMHRSQSQIALEDVPDGLGFHRILDQGSSAVDW